MPRPSLQLPFALIFLASPVPALAQNPWAEVELPSSGRTQSIGSYAAGCVAGAVDLPLVGEGYQAMRPSRNRSWGHPRLVAYVQQLGRAAKQRACQHERVTQAHDARAVGEVRGPLVRRQFAAP